MTVHCRHLGEERRLMEAIGTGSRFVVTGLVVTTITVM